MIGLKIDGLFLFQKKEKITEYKSSNEYKNLLEAIPDIELIDIEKKDD